MKATLPRPERESYLRHRRQLVSQILVPVILATVLLCAAGIFLSVAAFRPAGDVERWGAIAASWLVLLMLVPVLVLAAIVGALAYLAGRLLGILPAYTGKAQDLVYRLESITRRFSNALVKPVFGISEIGATLRALVGRR